ncbi:hypothetical protein F0562_018731 [Nyssa sinensis]|uniref:Uncharacterized protein n=1 Tax=Nyssa sinensis TaxID=561372 RepID=A0A5J4ZDP1_9ASTE|nr:hypothetical protein F0562_018731 [Nyssa sinensis]
MIGNLLEDDAFEVLQKTENLDKLELGGDGFASEVRKRLRITQWGHCLVQWWNAQAVKRTSMGSNLRAGGSGLNKSTGIEVSFLKVRPGFSSASRTRA